MDNTWYPKKLNVTGKGTPATYNFLKTVFHPNQHFTYAEFGFYNADTASNVCELFGNATLHLFDYPENIERAKDKLKHYSNKIYFYDNSQRFNDSYNWSLIKIIQSQNSTPLFDYCFLDGAHTFAIDALTFFLCDRLTRVGGYIDFDDYGWTLRNSSLDPAKVPEIALQYTDEQIDTKQVALIVDHIVENDPNYKKIIPKKIYQKIRHYGETRST